MKLIYCLLLSSLMVIKLNSQSCRALDNTLFFKSIQFGDRIPGDLIDFSKRINGKSPYYTNFRLQYDSLNRNYKKKYADLFTFLSLPFSFVQISENEKRQVYIFELYFFFDGKNIPDSTIYRAPAQFTATFEKLISLYGKPAGIEEASSFDSLYIRASGMPRLVYWNCNNISLQLRVRYGAKDSALNVMAVQIKDRRFELVGELKLAEQSKRQLNIIHENN